jgi:hypothetical protein
MLRAAFERRARAHAITLEPAQLQELVDGAARRADGVLWRRALAEAACAELGVDLAAAVRLPELEQAHELAGAPEWTPSPEALPSPAPSSPTPEPAPAPAVDEAHAEVPEPDVPESYLPEPDEPAPAEPAPDDGASAGEVPEGSPDVMGEADALEGAGAIGTADADPFATPDAPAPERGGVVRNGADGTARRAQRRRTGQAPPRRRVPAPEPTVEIGQALRLAAVHLGGIETVRTGDRDIELRLSAAGLDVLRRSDGTAIGRLEWQEIQTIDLPRGRRGLRPGKRRVQELHVSTERGQASFELPGLTEAQVKEHLEPMLDRARRPA